GHFAVVHGVSSNADQALRRRATAGSSDADQDRRVHRSAADLRGAVRTARFRAEQHSGRHSHGTPVRRPLAAQHRHHCADEHWSVHLRGGADRSVPVEHRHRRQQWRVSLHGGQHPLGGRHSVCGAGARPVLDQRDPAVAGEDPSWPGSGESHRAHDVQLQGSEFGVRRQHSLRPDGLHHGCVAGCRCDACQRRDLHDREAYRRCQRQIRTG
nr:hypothetical protein [Tanacetum cinerariifolium]